MLKRAKSFFTVRKKATNKGMSELPESSHLRRNLSIKVTRKEKQENVFVLKPEQLIAQRPRRQRSDNGDDNDKNNNKNNTSKRSKGDGNKKGHRQSWRPDSDSDVSDSDTLNVTNEFLYESHRGNKTKERSKSLDRGIKFNKSGDPDWMKEQIFVDGDIRLRGKDLVDLEATYTRNTVNNTWCSKERSSARTNAKQIANDLRTSDLFASRQAKSSNKFKLEPTSTLKRMMMNEI